jgi:hypothetical protein
MVFVIHGSMVPDRPAERYPPHAERAPLARLPVLAPR